MSVPGAWRVPALAGALPAGVQAWEDADVLQVVCDRCGWIARYNARAVDMGLVLRDARGHAWDCPGRAHE